MENYFNRHEVSNSDLGWLLDQLNPKERFIDPTQAFADGNLLDAMITEPEKVDYFKMTREGVSYKKSTFENTIKMKQSFWRDPLCRDLMKGADSQKISIEHGAKMDEETVKLYKVHGAFLCTTISPALPYALFDTAVSGASEKDRYNGRIVFDGIVESAKTALANGIPVGLGNDVGCPYITQYDFWRELCYFHKYCGVSNQFALYTATLRNARLAGVGDVTGSLEVGKSEDLIVTRQNPLEDLRALQHLELVACRGRVVKKPAPKRNQTVDKLLDPYLE